MSTETQPLIGEGSESPDPNELFAPEPEPDPNAIKWWDSAASENEMGA